MWSTSAHTRNTGLAIAGTLVLASTLLLSACGGGSSTESSAPASAEAVSAEPPRPSGLSDDDWAALVDALGTTDTMMAQAQAKTPEELAADCQQGAPTDEEIQAVAEQSVTQYPGTTAEGWIALLEWGRDQAQIVWDTVCADVPADGAAAPSEGTASDATGASGAFDPPRPNGVPDSDWAAYLTTWEANGFMDDADPEILDEYCAKDEASVREDTIGGLPENSAAEYPESTLEEWTAFYDYSFALLEEYRQQLCANRG
jgi:hypothetical protein